jgi:hypothetical protein
VAGIPRLNRQGIGRAAPGSASTDTDHRPCRHPCLLSEVMSRFSPVRSAVEARSSLLVNVIAIAALVYVIVRTTLVDVSDVIPGGVTYWSVLQDLALAYLAAWIFNLLVIEIPRRRDRRRIFASVGWIVGLIAQTGLFYIDKMASEVGLPAFAGTDEQRTQQDIDQMCAAIDPNIPYTPWPEYGTWYELLKRQINKATGLHERLTPWLPYFDAEIQSHINAVLFSTLVMSLEELPRIANASMAEMSGQMFQHWQACDALMRTYQAEIRSMSV